MVMDLAQYIKCLYDDDFDRGVRLPNSGFLQPVRFSLRGDEDLLDVVLVENTPAAVVKGRSF